MKSFIIADLEKTRNYTTAVAEAMPEESWSFKPSEQVWNFAELVHHIAYSLDWMESNYIRKEKAEWDPGPVPEGKKAVLSYLGEKFSSLEKAVQKKGDWENEDVKSFYAIIEHNAHHRGQAVTYLRITGIVPPEYPF
ncbi:MAG TPA: DinB family protein [Chitinophagaceae bacterium]|nr:DinB family protein [Chitinophagaceae bacterium]